MNKIHAFIAIILCFTFFFAAYSAEHSKSLTDVLTQCISENHYLLAKNTSCDTSMPKKNNKTDFSCTFTYNANYNEERFYAAQDRYSTQKIRFLGTDAAPIFVSYRSLVNNVNKSLIAQIDNLPQEAHVNTKEKKKKLTTTFFLKKNMTEYEKVKKELLNQRSNALKNQQQQKPDEDKKEENKESSSVKAKQNKRKRKE